MTAHLVFLTGSRAGTAHDLYEEDVTFGRKGNQTIVFGSEDVLVSAQHATMIYRDGQYRLRDDGSRNGTFVNAQRITEHVLEDGDLIQFGAGGPGARFLLKPAIDAAPTLDPRDVAEAAEMLRSTKPDILSQGMTATASRALTTTREMVVMAVRRSKRNRRWLLAVAVITIAAISTVVVSQQRSKANLERTLSQLSVSLATERESRSALEEVLNLVQSQADSLRTILENEQRKVANDPRIDPDAIRDYSRGVALLVFTYGYMESGGDRLLRYVVDSQGEVVVSPGAGGQPVPGITFGGSGPPIQHQGTATGFLIDSAGFLLSNRHVAVPWEQDEQFQAMVQSGLNVTGTFIDLRAFFPPGGDARPLVVEKVSDDADVALFRVLGGAVAAPVLPLAPEADRAKPGDELVLIGYPTGVQNLLFRVNRSERGTIFQAAGGDARRLAEELARRRVIQPLVIFGSISDTTGMEVIHTANTTVGGSGGPLIDLNERVVAVHYASVRSPSPGDPFQTQRGVPVRFVWRLLPPTVRQGAISQNREPQ
jgi:S1-C subfamily serine protease